MRKAGLIEDRCEYDNEPFGSIKAGNSLSAFFSRKLAKFMLVNELGPVLVMGTLRDHKIYHNMLLKLNFVNTEFRC